MRLYIKALSALVLWAACVVPALSQDRHDYRVELYDRLHSSPMQEKFRRIAPMPAGAVYVQRPGEGEKEIREHMRTLKRLGFNALKQVMTVPGWEFEDVAVIALEEGIIPWWYGEGGWEPITDDLMRRLGIPADTPIEQVRNNPKMRAYQMDLMRKRVEKSREYRKSSPDRKPIQDRSVAFDPTIGGRGLELTPEGERLFVEWVRRQYPTIEALNKAWNQQHAGLQPQEGEPFSSWSDFEARWKQLGTKEYRHLRDILRFKADHNMARIEATARAFNAYDGNAPFRGGGELGLFHPQTWYGVDLEGIAGAMTRYGSFYPSMHLAWHFGEVDYEVTRPVYMQAALGNDLFKGGWAAAWEATGGPQQFSGGEGGTGFTVDEGFMSQFLLSHLAAGFKGFGLWSWSTRTAGWEAGEYSLLDRHNKVTQRAIRAGQIGQTMNRYRDELWQAHKEPYVGVLVDWDSDAMWTAMSFAGRDEFKNRPIDARIGISRALINANVPYEYVTATDLRAGLAPRYRVIYVPFGISISDDLLNVFSTFVASGGRLVMDMPSAWYDAYGALLSTDRGTAFERVFGTVIDEYQYAGTNRPVRLGELELKGFTTRLSPTTARVVERYDDMKPAITENQFGRGTAVILGYEASMMAFKPGNTKAEAHLVRQVLGSIEPPYAATGAIVYRLASPKADHFFLINDGPATTAKLETKLTSYRQVVDAVTGEVLNLNAIRIPGYDARWLRAEK